VLNYFTTFGSRGADNQQEFDRQRAKIVVVLANIEAEMADLIKIENNESAIQDLVNALNELLGPNTYDYINTGKIGTDEIKVAFVYKSETVSLRRDYAILDSEVNPRFTDHINRPVLAQNFVEKENQEVFTIAVNILNLKARLVVKEMMILFRVIAIIRVPRQL